MAEQSKPVPNATDRPVLTGSEPEPTEHWEQILYAPARVEKWLRGEITLQELSAISGPEMLEMAVIGFSMYEQGKYDQAKVVFTGLCALDQKEGYYRTALGAVYLAQDELDLAEEALSDAIKLNDKEIASYVNRGEVYLRKGKILDAAQDFKKAVDLDPMNKDPLSGRARLLAAAAVETLRNAQKEAQNAAQPAKAAAAPAKKK